MTSREELLKYKFELEVAYDGLGRGLDIADVKDAISLGIVGYEKMLNLLFNPKPYNFEDLKVGMWVWDNVAKECLYVVRPFITTGVRVKYFTCLGIWNLEKIKKLNMKFEENRFFPMEYANIINIRKDNKKQ